jgi:hypothetical protein
MNKHQDEEKIRIISHFYKFTRKNKVAEQPELNCFASGDKGS